MSGTGPRKVAAGVDGSGPNRAGDGRRRALARAIGWVIAVHLGLACLQFTAAWVTGSAGVTASAVHVGIGLAAHASALGGIWFSTRPADTRHPYGYERVESLSALGIGMLLLASVALIVLVAGPRLLHPEPVEQAGWGTALMVASAAANAALFLLLRAQGQRLSSQILLSESVHALADAATSLAVVLGLAASSAGLLRLDPIVALGLAAVVAWRAWSVVRTAAAVLTDVTPVDVEVLRQMAMSVPGVIDCHAVRSRGESGWLRVDLHIHVPPDMTVREAHAIAGEVERTLMQRVEGIVEVLIHVGPQSA